MRDPNYMICQYFLALLEGKSRNSLYACLYPTLFWDNNKRSSFSKYIIFGRYSSNSRMLILLKAAQYKFISCLFNIEKQISYRLNCKSMLLFQNRGWQAFSVKGQIISTLGIADHKGSVTITEFHSGNVKVVIYDMPIKL